MKKMLYFKMHWFVFFICILGCSDNLDRCLSKLRHTKYNIYSSLDLELLVKSKKSDGWRIDTVPSENKLDPEALQYYKDIEKAIFITNSHKQSTEDNPFKAELNNLIIKNTNGERISFFSLSEIQKKKFLSKLTAIKAKQLGDKMKIAPEERYELQFEDLALQTVLNIQINKNSKNGLEGVFSNKNFFSLLDKERKKLIVENELNIETNFNQNSLYYSLCQEKFLFKNNKPSEDSLLFIKARDTLVRYAAAGELLLRLPVDRHPYIVTNLTFKNWGHVAILIGKITDNINKNDVICIAANRHDVNKNKFEQVRNEELGEWCCSTCYVIGLQKVEYHLCSVVISDVMTEILLIRTKPITNLFQIASEATKYLGKPYASKWKSFIKATDVAPNEFTCTTLAWWCIKQIFGIEIRNNTKSKMITPGDIYRNQHVYILAKIKK